MLLAVDIGNTNIVYGLFKGNRLIKVWRFPTELNTYPPAGLAVDRILVASVVPAVNGRLGKGLKKRYKVNPYFVTAENIPLLKVKMKNKREIGADRVVDALAAYTLYNKPCIIVDFGTATTFDLVSGKGEYLGGAIAPGVLLARDSLHERTAKLPLIEIEVPRNVIGKNTKEAMQSGLVFGYVAMVEGMINRIKAELIPYPPLLSREGEKKGVSCKVIATGGLAKLICKYTKVVDRIDMNLTLKGLKITGDNLERRIK